MEKYRVMLILKPNTFQSNGMQVLKIRKSKNMSLNMQMPSDIRKENNVRSGSFTTKISTTKR